MRNASETKKNDRKKVCIFPVFHARISPGSRNCPDSTTFSKPTGRSFDEQWSQGDPRSAPAIPLLETQHNIEEHGDTSTEPLHRHEAVLVRNVYARSRSLLLLNEVYFRCHYESIRSARSFLLIAMGLKLSRDEGN